MVWRCVCLYVAAQALLCSLTLISALISNRTIPTACDALALVASKSETGSSPSSSFSGVPQQSFHSVNQLPRSTPEACILGATAIRCLRLFVRAAEGYWCEGKCKHEAEGAAAAAAADAAAATATAIAGGAVSSASSSPPSSSSSQWPLRSEDWRRRFSPDDPDGKRY